MLVTLVTTASLVSFSHGLLVNSETCLHIHSFMCSKTSFGVLRSLSPSKKEDLNLGFGFLEEVQMIRKPNKTA